MKGKKDNLVGRPSEIASIEAAAKLGRNLLIEGPVGVGKTYLVLRALERLNRKFERIDGDSRYTEQKLTGWFDPPLVLKKGYVKEGFIEGPLATAMKDGKVLFINELNRMPEAVQNILLPAMDERRIQLPKLGELKAKTGFLVIATQNPREFTATHALSEALLDRFEILRLDYQTRAEEIAIVKGEADVSDSVIARAVDLARATRSHQAIKRGASVRAAIAVAKLVEGGMVFDSAALMALPTRIEMVSLDEDPLEVIRQLLTQAELPLSEKKKELNQ